MSEQNSGKTILVIEDEHQLRTLLVLMLEHAGHRVLEAAHPNEAANVWRREGSNIALIIADVWLPGISGPELVGFFRREHVELRSLFITGMTPQIQPEFRKLTRNSQVLPKPFTREQLLKAVSESFASEEA